MRVVYLSVPLLLIGLLTPTVFNLYWHERAKDKNQAVKQAIIKSLDRIHFNRLNLDDDFSRKAFELYLKALDADKRFMLQADYDQLAQYKEQIDDELIGDFGAFLRLSAGIMDKRVQDAKQFTEEILAEPFDFEIKEEIELDEEKRSYPSNQQEHREAWRQLLKYQTMLQYHNKLEAQEKEQEIAEKEGKPFEAKTPEQLEKSAREQVSKTFKDWFDRLEKEDDDDKRAKLLNAIVGVYGPHTEFLPPEEKENFDIRMSGKLEGIGAQLIQRNGEIKVTRVVPGSASWRQGDLKEEDIILKVAQGDDGEPVSVVGMVLKDAIKMIRGPKGSKVRLTVKKKSGKIEEIPIIRDVVILEESYVKSAVITNKQTGRKYGYMLLPSFYADFNRSGGRNSGDDVAQELIKLKQANVDGILFDLRNNGGGSLWDAVKITGQFIPTGPVVQVRDRINTSKTHKDPDLETRYDGPLIVLVNKFSASASEITAAALQDYGRAVIVGEESFGKGTVQRFIELDRIIEAEYRPAGSLKLTTQKFYRITGKTTQVKGVQPDITLPSPYSYIDYGEKELDHVLPFDEIRPVLFNDWDNTQYNIKKLEKNSKKRVSNNETFSLIEEYAKTLKERQDNTTQTLHYQTFREEQEKLKEESKKYEDIRHKHDLFKVEIMDPIVDNNTPDSVRLEMNKKWLNDIKEDVYLYESALIMEDMF